MKGLKRGEIACRERQVQKSVSFRVSLMKGLSVGLIFFLRNFRGVQVFETVSWIHMSVISREIQNCHFRGRWFRNCE